MIMPYNVIKLMVIDRDGQDRIAEGFGMVR